MTIKLVRLIRPVKQVTIEKKYKLVTVKVKKAKKPKVRFVTLVLI
jgi:hypothetical protein